MSGVQRMGSAPRMLGVIAVVALTGGTGVAAGAAPITLRYTCSFPLIGAQPMTTTLLWNASDRHTVGQTTPPLPVDASAVIGSFVPDALRFAGASTVEGTADATAVVVAPEGDISVATTLTVPPTAVPASGSMTFDAHGTAASMVFTRPGEARIVVGRIALRMTPRNANGDLTVLGVVQASCELEAGQDGVLASFRIQPAAGGTAPPTGGPPQSTAGPTGSSSPALPAGPTGSIPTQFTGPGTAAGSAVGIPGTASAAATAASGDDRVTRSSAASAFDIVPTGGSNLLGLLLVAVGVPAAGVVVCGCVWWLRRRRGTGPEVVRR